MEQKRIRSIARSLLERGHRTLGNGWSHVSRELRWGLVAAELVAFYEGQDEEISRPQRSVFFDLVASEARRFFEDEERQRLEAAIEDWKRDRSGFGEGAAS